SREEQRQAVERSLRLTCGGARQEQDAFSVLGVGRPDFLTADHPVVFGLVVGGRGGNARGIRAGGRLGDAEGDQELAFRGTRQVCLLEVLRAVVDNRSKRKDIKMNSCRATGSGAGFRDCLEQKAGFGQAKSRAAVSLGNKYAKP